MYSRRVAILFILTLILNFSISLAIYAPPVIMPDSVKAIGNVNDLQPYFVSDKFADRMNGVERLGQIGNNTDIPFLLELYENTPFETFDGVDRTKDIKDQVLLAIGEIGGPEAESAIFGIINTLNIHDISLHDSLDIITYSCLAFADMSSFNAFNWLNGIYTDTLLEYGYRVAALEAIYLIELSKPEYYSAKDTVEYLLDKLSKNFSRDIRQIDDFIITKAVGCSIRDISSQAIYDELSAQSTKFADEIELGKFIDILKLEVEGINNSPVKIKWRW